MPETDELTNLKEGNSIHTEVFVRQNIGWMLAVASNVLRDSMLAEDAVQNAFANIFKNLETFEERSQLKTWMHKIVVNESLMLLRKRKRLHEISIEEHLPEFDDLGCRIEDPWTKIETPEALMQQVQIREKVAELIDYLPDMYRIVLTLRDIEELSTAEVAELLDMSETNVKVRLHRARAALKKLLEPFMRGQAL